MKHSLEHSAPDRKYISVNHLIQPKKSQGVSAFPPYASVTNGESISRYGAPGTLQRKTKDCRCWGDEEQPEAEEQPQAMLQIQALLPRVEERLIPEVSTNIYGKAHLKNLPDRVVASSKSIELLAKWNPSPHPPNGHSPDALVGWVQNINYKNEQADYFTDDEQYVETYFVEYIGQMIDNEDEHSPWYNPPRPYYEVANPNDQLFGLRQQNGPIGQVLVDNPQDFYLKTSPKGGKLYRFGGEVEFTAYLVIAEPEGYYGTVLEFVKWKYEYAYTFNELSGEYDEQYSNTFIVERGAGAGRTLPNLEIEGPRGNFYFNDVVKPSWEDLPAAHDIWAKRFPSFI